MLYIFGNRSKFRTKSINRVFKKLSGILFFMNKNRISSLFDYKKHHRNTENYVSFLKIDRFEHQLEYFGKVKTLTDHSTLQHLIPWTTSKVLTTQSLPCPDPHDPVIA